MPIYAYKCASCGHAKDVLQKISDAPLTVCPSCGAEAFTKQVTAAGFQLKGSGWYATDFRGGGNANAPASDKSDTNGKPGESKPADTTATPKTESAKPSEGSSGGSGATGKTDAPSASAGAPRGSVASH
jgi:putative FmdB family regulatory protein